MAAAQLKGARQVVVVLLPRFSMLTLSGLLEPLRIANYCAGEERYQWRLVSAEPGPVPSSTGVPVATDSSELLLQTDCDLVLLCGGWNAERYTHAGLRKQLRQAAHRGALLGAVETGSYVLAEAGLLEGRQATIHWHCRQAFAERFADVEVVDQLFVEDRRRLTCAGGVACLDLMLHYIETDAGAELRREVSDQLVYALPREAETEQRPVRQRLETPMPLVLQKAIELMEEHIEEPLSIPELARRLGLSQRKLAALSGVSNATISLIEHGRTDPSMGMLKKILDAMGVSFAEFFSAENRSAEKFFFAADELSEISKGPISYRQVGSDLHGSQLQILYERYKPGADTGQSMLSHDAEEGGVILSGRLEVTVGEKVQVLSAGDAYRFNSRLPHRFRNTGSEDCVIVSACTPPSF